MVIKVNKEKPDKCRKMCNDNTHPCAKMPQHVCGLLYLPGLNLKVVPMHCLSPLQTGRQVSSSPGWNWLRWRKETGL